MPDASGRAFEVAVDRLAAAAARRQSAVSASLGIQRVDLLVVEYVAGFDGVTPTEVAGALQLSSGGATAVADRLIAAGFISRRPGPGGRRRVLLRATARGREAVDRGRALLRRDVDALADSLTSEERAWVVRTFDLLVQAMDRQVELTTSSSAAPGSGRSEVASPVLWG